MKTDPMSPPLVPCANQLVEIAFDLQRADQRLIRAGEVAMEKLAAASA